VILSSKSAKSASAFVNATFKFTFSSFCANCICANFIFSKANAFSFSNCSSKTLPSFSFAAILSSIDALVSSLNCLCNSASL
tara:strand:+ start:531 stop:776 length:246 start_codon:yes stop_codon:yes gene_type:complete